MPQRKNGAVFPKRAFVESRQFVEGFFIANRKFAKLLQKPAQLPPEVLARSKKEGIERTICDYLAGMTDRFALDEYKRLFEPYERV